LEIRNSFSETGTAKIQIGHWWVRHKVAKNFLVNFERNIETPLLRVDELLE
jgi:hypothetical protein